MNEPTPPLPPTPQQPVIPPVAPLVPTPVVTTPPVVQVAPMVSPPNAPLSTKFMPPKLLLIVIAAVIALIIAGISIYFVATKVLPAKTGQGTQAEMSKVPAKYAADSDGDGIPDALETEVGLNPTVSEFTRCQPESCGSADLSQAQTQKNNILFIIDSSGSMGTLIGGKTKMDLAKQAIRSFLASTASNVDVGIMVYGNKGSNDTSAKAVSCASADIIAPIGSVTSSTVETYLSQINPVGWTPIGLAIQKGKDAFVGKEGQKNQMIIVTDGAETCDTNPAGAAAAVKSSAYEIRVDVIGFAVNSSEQAALQAISTSGGGLFSVAVNADELLSQMRASHENYEKAVSSMKCNSSVYQASISCLEDVRTKATNFLTNAFNGKKGTEYQQLYNLESQIFKLYTDEINKISDEWSSANKKQQEQINK